jgi:hypothetical protein
MGTNTATAMVTTSADVTEASKSSFDGPYHAALHALAAATRHALPTRQASPASSFTMRASPCLRCQASTNVVLAGHAVDGPEWKVRTPPGSGGSLLMGRSGCLRRTLPEGRQSDRTFAGLTCQGTGWPKSGSKGRRSAGQTVPEGGVVRWTR